MMNWYQFRQNNSGGVFQIDNNVSLYVLIEAPHAVDAHTKASAVGIYFDGCEQGIDCDCCGDRWTQVNGPLEQFVTWGDLFDFNGPPTTHNTVQSYAQTLAYESYWTKDGQPGVIVYHADGRVERFYKGSSK